jgi:hypothetical protein
VFLLRSKLKGLSNWTPFLAEVLRMRDFAADFLQKQQTARRPRCAGPLANSLLNSEKFPVLREFHGVVYAASCPAARRR